MENPYFESKICVHCDGPAYRNPTEGHVAWEKRKFCSLKCTTSHPQEKWYNLKERAEKLVREAIILPNGCLESIMSCGIDGYIKIKVLDKTVRGHRFVYEQLVGPIPEGLVLRHTCDHPKCINVLHLIPGTVKDNAQDCTNRHRQHETNIFNEDIPYILERVELGETYGEIAKTYKVNPGSVSKALKKRGEWKRKRKVGPTTQQKEDLLNKIRNGSKYSDLSREFNMNNVNISQLAIRNGIRRQRQKLSKEETLIILSRIKTGELYKSIAIDFNTAPETISSLALRNGIRRTPYRKRN